MELGVSKDGAYNNFLLIRQTNSLLERALDRQMVFKWGVSTSALEVLLVIHGAGPQSAYRVAQRVGREHHSIVELVNRLIRKGLLTRKASGRKSVLRLTKDGERILGEIMKSGLVSAVYTDDKKLNKAVMQLRTNVMERLGYVDHGNANLDL